MAGQLTKTHKRLIMAGVFLLIGGISWMGLFETNEAGWVSIRQMPVSGAMLVVDEPGMYGQWFGDVFKYKKAGTFSFGSSETDDSATSRAITVRFNDGGTAKLKGNVRFRLPATDTEGMLLIHSEFRSYDHLVNNLVKKAAAETLILTASLMSAEDSYAGERAEFMRHALEQLQHGNYQTESEELEVTDDITKEMKIVKSVKIKYGDDGQPLRRKNPLLQFNIEITQFILDEDFDYEQGILDQIQKQRDAYMQTVAAKASATKSVQDEITAEKKGLADVATAKYEQEVIKIRAVVKAEQEAEVEVIAAKRAVNVETQKKIEAEIAAEKALEVAKFDRQAASEEKAAAVLRGEGQAEARKLLMQSDGALSAKLEAWVVVNANYAAAIADYTGDWVPKVMMGGNSANGSLTAAGGGATTLIELLTAKTAKDLALDLSVNEDATTNTEAKNRAKSK